MTNQRQSIGYTDKLKSNQGNQLSFLPIATPS